LQIFVQMPLDGACRHPRQVRNLGMIQTTTLRVQERAPFS
jgi:hypothetical protein